MTLDADGDWQQIDRTLDGIASFGIPLEVTPELAALFRHWSARHYLRTDSFGPVSLAFDVAEKLQARPAARDLNRLESKIH